MLQPPQLVGSVRSLTHSPRSAHQVNPTAQQTPLWQASPFGHARPQTPQFCESVITFTQALPHAVSPWGQTQVPSWQLDPDGHVLLQPPASLSPASSLVAVLDDAPLPEPVPELRMEPAPMPEPTLDPEPTPVALEPVALASIDPAPATPAEACGCEG
jgi:hypothetical protein